MLGIVVLKSVVVSENPVGIASGLLYVELNSCVEIFASTVVFLFSLLVSVVSSDLVDVSKPLDAKHPSSDMGTHRCKIKYISFNNN